jgi:hypothetical protein
MAALLVLVHSDSEVKVLSIAAVIRVMLIHDAGANS